MIEQLRKMRPIELLYKEFYETSGRNCFDHPIELEEFQQIITNSDPKYRDLYLKDFATVLEEDNFFQNSQDVVAFHHYRYMPASYHAHDFFEVACVLSGTFHNYIGDKECSRNREHREINSRYGRDFPLYPGDIFILAPHTRHAVCAYHEDSIMINILIRSSTFNEHFMNVLPDNDMLRRFFANTLFAPSDTPWILFKTGEDEELMDCILNMEKEFARNSMYKNTMLVALVSIFLVTLLRKHEKDVIIPTIHPTVMNETTIFILQYMQKNFSTITLAHLASFFNYSERQMQRIITSATGMSFSENIKKLRMEHAQKMLQNPNLPISQIADALGYYDSSNFRHIFKNYYGMTPQQYRSSLDDSAKRQG